MFKVRYAESQCKNIVVKGIHAAVAISENLGSLISKIKIKVICGYDMMMIRNLTLNMIPLVNIVIYHNNNINLPYSYISCCH